LPKAVIINGSPNPASSRLAGIVQYVERKLIKRERYGGLINVAGLPARTNHLTFAIIQYQSSLAPSRFTWASHSARRFSEEVLTGPNSVIRTGRIPQNCKILRFIT